ncbi:hypothetical protein ABS71_04105 [bacterium SCN 62-11]|nr:MAG: hypothetical protein ABS71_04105 [bacterium SCN 62-11]
MRPLVTQSLRRAEEIPCMIICSGTSRLVVIGGEFLPPPGEQRNQLLLDLMHGKPQGLGGESSQNNKVSVVTSQRARQAFQFHFYQVVPQTGQLFDQMECSNAAAAAGLFARLSRVARPRTGSTLIETTNTATGQHIVLSIPAEGEMWKQPWGIRFELPTAVAAKYQLCRQATQLGLEDGRLIDCHIIKHGNVFAFCQLPPEEMTEALALELSHKVIERAVELARAEAPFLPKVIPYAQMEPHQFRTASYFEGERHSSMPGSAGMALGLLARIVLEIPGRDYEIYCGPRHQELMRVQVGENNSYTQFETPVRLLLHGAAPVPPQHSFFLEPPEEATSTETPSRSGA